ncbi:MAG: hypothetical protein DI587_11930 [Variovorax paradoxus]|nr:MAG: hypothetical protein DI583_11930 [Variovorax paradoxus]PZQ10559.1 MAG: hypothetical protein DI587_11930 [Variovorax paradoxus]
MQSFEDAAATWAALPDWIRPQPGLFVAQAVGESMNRRIPSGAWCLLRASPAGTRQGSFAIVAEFLMVSEPAA